MLSMHALRESARRIRLVVEVSTVVTESHRLSGGTLHVFSREGLAGACSELGERHPNQDLTLQFTRANYQAIVTRLERFKSFGATFVQL
jgi:hypothetical protein